METKRVDEILREHGSEKGALISVLHVIQAEEGFLPRDVLDYLSDRMGIPIADISRVVTFFGKAFRLAPEAAHSIRVCRGTTCHIKRSGELQKEIREELEKDEKSKYFTLGQARCLGCCTTSGPVVEIDGTVHDRESAKNTIIQLKSEK